jgi:release factor glutamine methyltransferase
MSPSPDPDSTSPDFRAVVTILRAAGCVFAEDEARLLIADASTPAALADMVDRRVAGVPLEYILGWAEFCGLRITVDRGVFVPRRRTEFLVQQAAGLAVSAPAARSTPTRIPIVLDMCCGSGAVGVGVAAAVGQIQLHAADIDPAAVRCAAGNVDALNGRVYLGDLYDALPVALRGQIDVLVANTPYVPTVEIGMMPPEARLFEPSVALDGGPDGLDLQRRVAASAAEWLAPGGHLLIETSKRQAPSTLDVFRRAGLAARVASSDELSATVVIGTRI